MIIEKQEDVTAAVLSELQRAPDGRFKEIMSALVRHLHSFAREVKLTEEELRAAAGYVVALGKHTSETHNEAVLMAGSLGDRKSTRLNSSHIQKSRMPSSA